jgi:hypothetical protein
MISKKLVLDTSALADSDNVGAYVRASDGTLITKTTSGAKEALDVNFVNTTIGVTATDLDIRDLTHVSDSVKLGDGTSLITSTTVGADVGLDVNLINASDIEVAMNCEYAEDTAHADADIGAFMLAVRSDTRASTAGATGDYCGVTSDALGQMWVNGAPQSGAYSVKSVANTATDLVTTDLANRKKIVIQNLSVKDMYVGFDASVTTSNGTMIPAKGSAEFEAGPGINFHGIVASGTADVRILEFA